MIEFAPPSPKSPEEYNDTTITVFVRTRHGVGSASCKIDENGQPTKTLSALRKKAKYRASPRKRERSRNKLREKVLANGGNWEERP